MLDEFDHHFNQMACDSLRYHLSQQCVVDNEERRPVYEDLIRRLAEPPPQPTPEEKAAIDTWHPLTRIAPGYESLPKWRQRHQMTECPPAARAAFASWRARQDEWRHRNDTARRDFVAIIRELWS